MLKTGRDVTRAGSGEVVEYIKAVCRTWPYYAVHSNLGHFIEPCMSTLLNVFQSLLLPRELQVANDAA